MVKVDAAPDVRAVMMRYRRPFVVVLLVSAVLNVLLLGGSIYMMMVYDSVLPSHSVPTLVGLFALVTVVYLFQGLFDNVRTRILADVAVGVDRALSLRVQRAMGRARMAGHPLPGNGLGPMRDLDHLRSFLASGGPVTLIDLPWVVFFIAVLFMLHVWIGVTALVGAAVLVGLAVVTERIVQPPATRLSTLAAVRAGEAEARLRHTELLTVLGMGDRLLARWHKTNERYQAAQNDLARTSGVFGGAARLFRLFLQSALLTVGALLVMDGRASGGIIFASSMLSGRALAPVEQVVAHWRHLISARLGWKRLDELLASFDQPGVQAVALPSPTRSLVVDQLCVAPPGSGRMTVEGVSFRIEAGEALGIAGPSAAGKSSLARALVGGWHPTSGAVRLDGATLDQWGEALGRHVGYLPQTVELLDGTVADNIARFMPNADDAAIVAAAQAAGAHDMIVGLPQGYQTPVGDDGAHLSAGQRQRVGLARALFNDPFLVLLDEPNSNLDAEGDQALEGAILSVRARGGIAIIIAHRPSALAPVDRILLLRDGRLAAIGSRDEVLAAIAPNVRFPAPGTRAPRLRPISVEA